MVQLDTTKTILVTGASGQYGRQAVDRLLELGVAPSNLLLLTRQPSKLSSYAARDVSIRQGSFDDPVEVLAAAFSGADTILLISTSRAGARLPQHQAAIDAAVRAGVSHIVYTSIISAHLAKPTALVAREHRATEAMLRASGCAWTALRDAQYADAMTDVVAPAALTQGLIKSNAGDGRIAFVAREDCVAAAVAVLAAPDAHRNKVYIITGPELLSWRDAGAIISEVNGRGSDGVAFEIISDDDMFAMFDQMGIPRHPVEGLVVGGYPWNSSDMVSFAQAIRLGEMAIISDDVEFLTGRKPKSFRQLLKERMAMND